MLFAVGLRAGLAANVIDKRRIRLIEIVHPHVTGGDYFGGFVVAAG